MENETNAAPVVKRVRIRKTWAGSVMTLAFIGYDVEGKEIGSVGDPLTFDRAKLNAANVERAIEHGCEQKIGDAAALARDPKQPLAEFIAQKRVEMADVIERLESAEGAWNVTAARGPVDAKSLLAKLAALGYDVGQVKAPVDITPKAE